jgi:hypothetical protein
MSCPFCSSGDVELISPWGGQMITCQMRCRACNTYFEAIRDQFEADSGESGSGESGSGESGSGESGSGESGSGESGLRTDGDDHPKGRIPLRKSGSKRPA